MARHAAEVAIGREPGVDVLLENDSLVSRRHAKVRRDWSGTTLEDLGSRNGVQINKKKARLQTLRHGDAIEIGSTRFLFLDPSEGRETPLVPVEPKPPEPPSGEKVEKKKKKKKKEEAATPPESQPPTKRVPSGAPAVQAESPPAGEAAAQAESPPAGEVNVSPEASKQEIPQEGAEGGSPDEAASLEPARPRFGFRLPPSWPSFVPLVLVGGIAVTAVVILIVVISRL